MRNISSTFPLVPVIQISLGVFIVIWFITTLTDHIVEVRTQREKFKVLCYKELSKNLCNELASRAH